MSVDSDGDGTLQGEEIRNFIDETIGGHEFDEEKEIKFGAESSILAINTNGESEIQTHELRDHWNSIAAMLTVDGVADWVAHGVALPQYARAFRENAINGFDLPSVMEDQSAYFDDLGISNRLHRKRFGRAIRILLLSIAEVPSKPAIRCWEGDTTKDGMSYIHIVWSPKFMCEADKGETSLCIPVHKWRLHRRTSNFDAWEFVGEFAQINDSIEIYFERKPLQTCSIALIVGTLSASPLRHLPASREAPAPRESLQPADLCLLKILKGSLPVLILMVMDTSRPESSERTMKARLEANSFTRTLYETQ